MPLSKRDVPEIEVSDTIKVKTEDESFKFEVTEVTQSVSSYTYKGRTPQGKPIEVTCDYTQVVVEFGHDGSEPVEDIRTIN